MFMQLGGHRGSRPRRFLPRWLLFELRSAARDGLPGTNRRHSLPSSSRTGRIEDSECYLHRLSRVAPAREENRLAAIVLGGQANWKESSAKAQSRFPAKRLPGFTKFVRWKVYGLRSFQLSPYAMTSSWIYVGVSGNRGPQYSTLNSRILIMRTPKYGTPDFRKLPCGEARGPTCQRAYFLPGSRTSLPQNIKSGCCAREVQPCGHCT